jgi:hypothetical protein
MMLLKKKNYSLIKVRSWNDTLIHVGFYYYVESRKFWINIFFMELKCVYFSSIFRKVPLLDFFAKYFVKKYIFFSFFLVKYF